MGDHELIPVTLENVVLFAERCIFYVLRQHNIHWHPLINYESLRRFGVYEMFTAQIGRALAHECMVQESRALASLTGFDEQAWLGMPLFQARWYINQHFLHFTFVRPIHNHFKNLYLWSFACYLCRIAAQSNKRIYISHILSQLVDIMYPEHWYLQHYEFLHINAVSYNIIHFNFHNFHPDEGYKTEEENQEEDNQEMDQE